MISVWVVNISSMEPDIKAIEVNDAEKRTSVSIKKELDYKEKPFGKVISHSTREVYKTKSVAELLSSLYKAPKDPAETYEIPKDPAEVTLCLIPSNAQSDKDHHKYILRKNIFIKTPNEQLWQFLHDSWEKVDALHSKDVKKNRCMVRIFAFSSEFNQKSSLYFLDKQNNQWFWHNDRWCLIAKEK